MRRLRRVTAPWLLGITLSASLAGCGGSQNDFVFGANPVAVAPAPTEVMGRVYLDQAINGASVTFYDESGRALGLGDTITDSNGFFLVGGAFPSNFEVSAILPAQAQAQAQAQGQGPIRLTAQVRGDAATSEVVVNAVTHLVSLYLKAHPELALDEAIARVKAFLEIPASQSIESLVDHPCSPFLHRLFLEQATEAGGLEPLFAQLLEELESGDTHAFVVGEDEEGSSFFAEVGSDIAKDIVKDQTLSVVGWAGKAMGLNLPFTSSLDDLAKKLDEISAQISELANEIEQLSDQAAYTAARSALETNVVAPVNGASNTLQQGAQNRAANPMTLPVPFGTVSPDAQPVLSAVGPFLSNTYLGTLFDRLLGTAAVGGINQRMERLLAPLVLRPAGLGDSDLSKYDGYPGRSVAVASTGRSMLNYYLNYADLSMNLYAESAHASANLATQIRNAQLAYHQTSYNKKLVAQQIPDDPASSQVYVDLEYGVMWYTVAQSKMTMTQAKSWASKFSGVGPYTDGWRIPKQNELYNLYTYRIKKGSETTSGKPATMLTRLGFDLSKMDNNHRVWSDDNGEYRYSLDTDNLVIQSASEHNNFLVCRTIPGVAEKSYSAVPPLSHLTPQSLSLTLGTTSAQGRLVQLNASANCGTDDPNVPMTTKVAWKSSDDTMASVSNEAGSEGQLVWHFQPSGRALAPVTVTASYNGRLNTTLVVPPPSQVPGFLSSIQISPYNVSFTSLLPVQEPLSATLFYTDPATGDQVVQAFDEVGAPPITWSLLNAQTKQPIPSDQGQILGTTTTPVIRLETTISAKSLILRAQSGAVTSDAPLFLP